MPGGNVANGNNSKNTFNNIIHYTLLYVQRKDFCATQGWNFIERYFRD